jgi:hypothetical protein
MWNLNSAEFSESFIASWFAHGRIPIKSSNHSFLLSSISPFIRLSAHSIVNHYILMVNDDLVPLCLAAPAILFLMIDFCMLFWPCKAIFKFFPEAVHTWQANRRPSFVRTIPELPNNLPIHSHISSIRSESVHVSSDEVLDICANYEETNAHERH